jgi:hypothetical protein
MTSVMERRAFATGLAALLARPLAGEAQQAAKPYRIGILDPGEDRPAAEMGPTTTSGISVTPGTAAGVAGGLLGLAGRLTGKKELSYAGQGVGTVSGIAQTAMNRGADAAATGALSGGVMAGFGAMASAANAETTKYISERMGPIAGQITSGLASLTQLADYAYPGVGTAASMFLEGIVGAIASGFSSPVYAEHRDEQ